MPEQMPLKAPMTYADQISRLQNARLFTDCLALRYIMHGESTWRTFVQSLRAVIDECPDASLACIGFPANWEDLLS